MVVRREFLGWDAPLLPRAAAFLYDTFRDVPAAGPVRLDGVLAVVPGRRAGRRLTELVLEVAEKDGRIVRPPDIVTVGSLPDVLGARQGSAASGLQLRLAWSAALRAADDLSALLSAPPAPEDWGGWWALGAQLASLRRELLGEGLDFADVARRVEEGLPDEPERWSLLAELAGRVDQTLERAGVRDPDRMVLEAIRAGEGSAGGRAVCLVGTAELPATARQLLGNLKEEVLALVHAPPEEEAAFRDDGTVRDDAWLERALPVEDGHLRVVDRPGDQAAAVAEALAETEGRWGPQDVVVGLGDEDLRPYVERTLGTWEVPTRYAPGRPLERTRPARLLQAVADYLREGEAEALAALLRHPDMSARLRDRLETGTDREWLAALDGHRARCLPARIPEAGPAGWPPAAAPRKAGLPLPLARALDEVLGPDPALLGGLHPYHRERPLREWAPAILELLLSVYGSEPLDRSRPEERDLLDALEALRDRLAELREVPPALDGPVEAAEALEVVLREARAEAVPPEPDSRAVELLGWLELRPDDAPAVVVAGMNEGRIPESVQGDPFLPDGLRSALGLLDNRRRYARDALALTALVHSRPYVRFVAGRRDPDGNPLLPSRLLLATSPEALPARVLRFVEGRTDDPTFGLAGEAPGSVEEAPNPAASAPAAGDAFPLPPEEEIRAAPPVTSLPVTDFGLLLTDPYAFALRRVRKLDVVDDTARELDPAAFGILLHDVLKRFGTSEAAGSTRAAFIADFLEETLETRARALFGSAPLPAVAVQVEQARLRLRAFAEVQGAWAAEGWEVAAVEVSTPPGGGAPFPDGGSPPFHLTGTIDRIDRHPERELWAVLDYKTGDQARTPDQRHRKGRGENRRWVDLQLPLYRYLLPELEAPVTLPVPPAEAGRDHVLLGYVNLPRQREKTQVALANWDLETLAGADEAARQVIRYVRENRFRYDPGVTGGPFDPFVELRGQGILGGAEIGETSDSNGDAAT